jgi:serine/threonine protein kinase
MKISDLLDRYSPEFSDFLCKCLRFKYKDRETINGLIGKNGHPWMNSAHDTSKNSPLKISLKDMIKVSGGWMEDKKSNMVYLDDFKKTQVEKLLDFIE